MEIIGTWGLYEGLVRPPETEDDCIHRRFAAFVEPLRAFPDTATFPFTAREAILACVRAFPTQTADNRLMLLMDREYGLFKMAERLLCQDEICRQFSSKVQYEDPHWPDDRLFVVGVKTTCKDRWRQVLNEARRVQRKHILTVQQGISAKQLAEMRDSSVSLVVPQKLHSMYPAVERMEVLTVRQFVDTVRRTLAITV